MATAIRFRPHTSAPSDGSRTITLLDAQSRPQEGEDAPGGYNETGSAHAGLLRLRATSSQRQTSQRVAWSEGVVDNEGCGRKKSKSTLFSRVFSSSCMLNWMDCMTACCIYHKTRRFDESSSDESDSDSGEDSDADSHSDSSREHNHHSGHRLPHSAHRTAGFARQDPLLEDVVVVRERPRSDDEMNAYERMPRPHREKRPHREFLPVVSLQPR